jgi:RHS repeat-associated protein
VVSYDIDGAGRRVGRHKTGGPWRPIFVADTINNRVMRRSPTGTESVYAGNGNNVESGADGDLATSAGLYRPWGLALLPDGSLLITTYYGGRVRRVDPSGFIYTFAGGGTQYGEGGLATNAQLHGPTRVAVADGRVFIGDQNNRTIRRVSTDGRITTVAGKLGDQGCTGSGGQATSARFTLPEGLAVHPDGSVLVADKTCGTIRRLAPANLGSDLGGGWPFGVPSEDGSEIYVFDEAGRHRSTRDARTGKERFRFLWTRQASWPFYLPTSVEDHRGASSARMTRIDRDTAGKMLRIITPALRDFTTTIDAQGYLWKLTRPAVSGQVASVYTMTYDSTNPGLLRYFWDPRGKEHRFSYDSAGKLLTDRDPYTFTGSAFKTLARFPLSSGNGHEVQVTTATGLASTYRVEGLASSKSWMMTGPDGRTVSTVTQTDESSTTTYPDGTTLDVTKSPDPRFGTSALVPSGTITLPSSKQLIVDQSRSVDNLSDPITFTKLTETAVVKSGPTDPGKTYTTVLDRAASPPTVKLTTPAGRAIEAKLDSLGRPMEWKITDGPLSSRFLYYDYHGRLAQIDHGTRRVQLAYDSSTGFLDYLWAGTTNNQQRHFVDLSIDARGQLGTIHRYDGKQVKFGYDASSNLTLLQRPTPTSAFIDHVFTVNDVDLLSTYVAPPSSTTHYAWDKDRRLETVTWPDATGIRLVYFPWNAGEAGKLQQLETLTSQVLSTYGYHGSTGRLATVSTSGGVTTGLGWDGPALTSVSTTWPNDVSRTVTWNLGDYLRVSSEHVTGGRSASYGYDADGLITQTQVMMFLDAHPLTVQRHAKTGWVTSTALKKISQAWGYDAVYGELQTVNTKFNGVDNVHTLTLETYDDLGRITTKKDKVLASAQTTIGYGYDSLGRLTSAGSTSWGYDPNGNRTHINGVTVASYDPQDWILTHQGASFTHDLNGNRKTKVQSGTTTYNYDRFGNLQSVLLPGGAVVSYDIDGAGRRVGRHKTGGTWRRYLLGEGNRVVAEYNEAGTIVSQFVYATRAHVPDFMIQGSNVYRFVTDQLGSVRLVVNVNGSTASGSVVQRIDYDAWGNVTNTPTSFDQPFGFAGGLWDRDTGLVHFGAREYDPVTGRWLQKDPIRFRGGDTNLYAYVGGDPVNRIDPSGRVGVRVGGTANWMHWVVGAQAGAGVFIDYDPWANELSGGVYFQEGAMAGGGLYVGAGLEGGIFRSVDDLAGVSVGFGGGCEGVPEVSTGAAVPLSSSSPYVRTPRWGADYIAGSVGPGAGAYLAVLVNWTHLLGGRWNLSTGRVSGIRTSGLP